ncbi:two-component system phosphate regulon sensor histidine kinase PhoR [Ruminiclostridium sufflavum DSM 19573]|uniref:histidine kinase n=1 Tax=Ruminiclostridium sufflavum DSM 19573 TaxID=1121337 RepID=A0A318XPE9_9FIRM|nr:ATP-binding protein [Ruminiclostridium sufflavum]PYG89764.1 two-component system phosphate regulon sensor histidine kinase PhoR [Ruminiclostridium sufflavum DSM 19573]
MKNKIVKYTILLVIIAITIAGIFTFAVSRYFYITEVKNSCENIAVLLAYQIEQQAAGSSIEYDNLAKSYAKIVSSKDSSLGSFSFATRITIIDDDGKVLGDSDSNAIEMENHISRKEIKAALDGKLGFDERLSKTLNLDYIYIAYPVKSKSIIVRVSVPLNQINSINKSFYLYTIIGVLVGLLLTVLIAVKVSGIITAPLNKLISTTKEIANGNYKKRAATSSDDEIKELACTFNEMADKLDNTLCGILDKNVRIDTIINSMRDGIIAIDKNYKILIINTSACDIFGVGYGPGIIGKSLLDITKNPKINSFLKDTIENNVALTDEITIFSPRMVSNFIYKVYTNPIKSADIKVQNAGGVITLHNVTSVKKLEQIRTEFVSNVTHELKTPLTSIRGFVETLKDGAIEDTAVAIKFLDIIDIEAERLYHLINDILQLSEIEIMRNDEHVSPNSLNLIVDDVVQLLEASANKKNIKLEVNIETDILICINKYRIKQMLINLIDNAIKYNVENGAVFITASKSKGTTTISVKDTGIGIPQIHHSRIFERFYRVDKGRSRNMGGTGLGLSIVKHIINLYNGDISVISEPGKGTEFIIRLPL